MVVHCGTAFSLNVSADGVLLLLDREPRPRQLLEIHNPWIARPQVITLFEVRWVTPLPTGPLKPQCLAGCRLAYGRFPYFLLQRVYLHQQVSGLTW